jgi:flagellar protein FliS
VNAGGGSLGAAAYQRAANHYGSSSAETASPQRLLVQLYDRLCLDLARAVQAQQDGSREVAHTNLLHAQDIVSELLSSLDVDAWEGGANLASLYRWLLREMIAANVGMDAKRTGDCLSVVKPLRDAWAQALDSTAAGGTGAGLIGATA